MTESTCRNCESRLAPSMQFCPQCGQSTAPIRTSTLEVMKDWSEHYVGSHGALWRTLAVLFRSPGKLTREYVSGRRTMYLKPNQLYFLASILMFAFVKLQSVGELEFKGEKEPISFSGDFGVWLDSIAPNLKHIVESRIKATNEMPRRELAVRINAFAVKYIPIGLFCLVPVLAFFLKMLWGWRRRYADHFVFTLHAQATVFLFLAIFHFGPKELGAYHCVVAAIMLWTLWRAFAYVYGGGVLKRLALLVPTVAVYFFALILVLLSLVFFGFAFG